jgi:hypothetical protein
LIRSFRFILLRRALGFWLGVRLLFLMTAGLSAASGLPIDGPGMHLTAAAALVAILATTALVLFDMRVVGEDVLLANFGVGRWQIAWPVLGLAVMLEVLTRLLAAMS